MRVIQKIRHSLGALSVILLTGSSCYAGINFGSQNSSLEILGNSSLRIPGSSMDVDEGTIKKVTASSILGGKVNFNNSIFFNNTTPMQINGVGNFGAIQEVSLSGNDDLFYSERGPVSQKVIVRGSRNRVEGSPHFTTANAIELHDHTVTLSIALASDLNQNLILNNGTLGLANNLKCADDVKLSGSGTVVFNGHQLTFGGKSLTYTDTIVWKNAADLVMSNDIIVYGQWIFDGDSVINGGGNIIDISSGSTLWIRNNTTLNLNSVKIKGLGTGSLIFEDATSQIRMSYCDIQMDRDFTMTCGGIYVDGPSVIVTQDKTLTMSAQASMTVDHLALEYDTLDFGTQDNILPTKIDDPNQKYIAYLNNGVIRKRVTESLLSTHSNALLALTTNNSNALLSLTTNNSNALLALTRYNSNALLSCCANNSNALLQLTANNSNALLQLTANNSNALLRLTTDNSNALLRLTTNNSNAIIAGEVGLAKYTSHALLYLIENESNALLSLFANTSNALLACCKNNSNALLRLTSNNSSAILNLDNMVRYVSNAELRLFKNNSDALLRLTTDNSNALLSCCANNSNALLQLTANNSNALLRLTSNNSSAILNLDNMVRYVSNAELRLFKNNSDALLRLTTDNSNALLSCCANNSNALLQLTANNSNALLRLTANNSNALLRLTTNNSNAIIAGEVGLAKYTSHALLYLIENESNALLSLFADTSNALLACCKNNSNALLRLTSNNSSAILNLDNMVRYVSNAELRLFKNNSDALLSLTTDNSNALLSCCANNSNALLRLTTDNSNALLRLTTNNSNAIIAGEVGLAKYTSHALLYLIENESNALLSLFANTSNALLACCKNNSNALLRLTSNNSSAILNLDNMVRYVSNAELRLFKNNSDALLSLTTDNSNALLSLTTNNSNSILYLQNLIGGGGGHIIIPGPTYTASRNIDVSSDSTVTVTGNVRFYGNGHVVDFGKSSANFIVDAGKFIVFENVILRNLASDSISLGAGANVVYGNGTCVEYNDTDNLSMNMTFSGTTLFEACCKRVKMDNSLIRVLPGGNLTVHGTLLDGLKGSNIRAEADWSTINFKNSQLYLSSDYSFTTGKILFEMDVEIAGTNKFVYAPTHAASKILAHSKLILDTGLTFSYSPSLANRDLLGMEDASSVLFLNGCSVHSTLTGMRLTKGTLFVDHKCQFFNPGATSMSQAIAFGDGTAANDLGIEIMPGGRIQVQSGQLAYQNTN